MRLLLSVAAVAVLALSACGKKGVGEACSQPSECQDKTSCILNGGQAITASGPACVDTDKLCSIGCAADADCAVLGPGHICITGCFQGSCLQGSRN